MGIVHERLITFICAVLNSGFSRDEKNELIAAFACNYGDVDYSIEDERLKDVFNIAISLWDGEE